jgi:uncharacterized protein (DUF58 family)
VARLARRLVLVSLAVALSLVMSTPATAKFAVTRGLPSLVVATAVVQSPTNVKAELASCSNARWMSVTVSWQPSTSARVSGYLVKAYRNDGQVATVGQTDGAATSANTTVDKLAAGSTSVTFTVTTLSDYGWTAESTQSAQMTC